MNRLATPRQWYRFTATVIVMLPVLIDLIWFEHVIVSLIYVPMTCLILAIIAKVIDNQFARIMVLEQGKQLKFRLMSFPILQGKARRTGKRRAA
ncbi:hypothetical protein [Thalassotalea mangrovi]|uniref:Uncharacterized protein n=1 Tax=Thalassotalea mangrovi TaxID=2572245 RepID=A0A4U1B706_9GAMM|nr:hypothetical protein [Thalassotalea mangrovi]TKB45646.1 hypothetical protein E8M12_07715 [Thalassotalea mangrovi]